MKFSKLGLLVLVAAIGLAACDKSDEKSGASGTDKGDSVVIQVDESLQLYEGDKPLKTITLDGVTDGNVQIWVE